MEQFSKNKINYASYTLKRRILGIRNERLFGIIFELKLTGKKFTFTIYGLVFLLKYE